MKINGTGGPAASSATSRAAEAAAAETPSAAGASAAAAAPAALQSAVLQPALQALRAAPDFDHAKVAMLRDALARGDVPFDAGRLAGLIERFHGGER